MPYSNFFISWDKLNAQDTLWSKSWFWKITGFFAYLAAHIFSAPAYVLDYATGVRPFVDALCTVTQYEEVSFWKFLGAIAFGVINQIFGGLFTGWDLNNKLRTKHIVEKRLFYAINGSFGIRVRNSKHTEGIIGTLGGKPGEFIGFIAGFLFGFIIALVTFPIYFPAYLLWTCVICPFSVVPIARKEFRRYGVQREQEPALLGGG